MCMLLARCCRRAGEPAVWLTTRGGQSPQPAPLSCLLGRTTISAGLAEAWIRLHCRFTDILASIRALFYGFATDNLGQAATGFAASRVLLCSSPGRIRHFFHRCSHVSSRDRLKNTLSLLGGIQPAVPILPRSYPLSTSHRRSPLSPIAAPCHST